MKHLYVRAHNPANDSKLKFCITQAASVSSVTLNKSQACCVDPVVGDLFIVMCRALKRKKYLNASIAIYTHIPTKMI